MRDTLKQLKISSSFFGALVVTLFTQDLSHSAVGTGTVQATVIAAIAIGTVSPLDFGSGSPGDGTKIVAPGTSESPTNGSFNVTGQPNTAYTISLPASVTLTTGIGGANRTIVVDSFVSFPAVGANGLIGAGGTQLLLIGATRAALPTTQVVGSYTGTYTVNVVY